MYSLKPPPTCGKHDRWVAVIGAAGNCRDDHRPMRQQIVTSFIVNRNGITLLFSCNLEAFEANLEKFAHKYKIGRALTLGNLTPGILSMCEMLKAHNIL